MRARAIRFSHALLLLCALPCAFAHAQTTQTGPKATLGTPQYSGTGCPSYSVSSALSPDAGALSVLFDRFIVEADQSFPIVRKSCNVAVPVQIPNGYRVSIVGIDYRGFNNLPAGAQTDFSVEYFFAGGSTSPYTTTFTGPLSANYLLQNTLDATQLSWSFCGGSSVLRINNSINVTTNISGAQAMSTIDSIEITANDPNRRAGIVFYLNWQSCFFNGASSTPSNTLLLAGLTGLLTWLATGI